ncbi:hypothetical protein F4802DRAFT_94576 [Xylaria palmicola]|nr:hypothetical protein F4802DRAFT_94576 [Xylaria palmicola]
MQSGVGPLEDRLRGLILTNSNSNPGPSSVASPRGALPSSHPDSNARHPAPKSAKRRPNQAQRRQMNAELSIPIDVRGPVHPNSPQYTRNQHYSGSSSFGHGLQQDSLSYTSASPRDFQDRSAPRGAYPHTRPRRGYAEPATASFTHQSDWGHQQPHNSRGLSGGHHGLSVDAFPPRGGYRHSSQPHPGLYNQGGQRQAVFSPAQLESQSNFLDQLAWPIILGAEIGPSEIAEKENFRMQVESICQGIVGLHELRNGAHEFRPQTVELKCFGSLASGFATKAADMDLGLLSPMSRPPPDSPESPIPRLIEKALLDAGFGARLLTKTRVPIIKLCEKPGTALQQSLLDARKKWESGMDQEEQDPDDDAIDDPDLSPSSNHRVEPEPKQPTAKLQMSEPSLGSVTVLPSEGESFSLRQSSNQSLASYYSSAKRLLRDLHIRDIAYSNLKDFTEADFILLDKVACAFVKGLCDTALRSRMLAYPSFHVGDTSQLTNYRSLFGVHMMVEGEKIVCLLETMQSTPSDQKFDLLYKREIRQWKDLQYSKNFGTNPLWFNKELQVAVEALRQIPFVQIMELRQDQYESPVQYHGRASKIASSLSRYPSFSGGDVPPRVIELYVDGIRDEKIRRGVRDFVAMSGTHSLRTVARKQKSLHLAADYERAMERGQYRPEDFPIIQRYLAILRREPIRSINRPIEFEYFVPIMQDEVGVLNSIRQLTDPATLSPNKPKDRFTDSLEFPKKGVGVQCDINFSAHLALHNTTLLRCYSCTDSRVRPLVLFVKHWAKARGINTPYRGTLSSYGYVLMVLHYLVNVVEPFVCPNLQELGTPDPGLLPQPIEGVTTCRGRDIRFWRDEQLIQNLAYQKQLNHNHDSLGALLRGFFEYYAQNQMMASLPKRGFNWGRDVISLRTHGGLLTKDEKGWTGAKTVIEPQTGAQQHTPAELDATTTRSPSLNGGTNLQGQATRPSPSESEQQQQQQKTQKPKEVKEVRYRFLFAIEDPFELDHNVARTVTHNGIVAVRDEFRRAWRIIKAAGAATEDLLADVKAQEEEREKGQFMSLLDEIHNGNEVVAMV